MTARNTHSSKTGNTRLRSEELVTKEDASAQEPLSPEQMRQMLHEFRVHQIELEIRNEELQCKQQDLENSRARYLELYDLAPVGYLTLDEQGLIVEANLTAGTLLGMPRTTLLNQPLTRFFPPEDHNIYHLQRKHLFESLETQSWDMRIINSTGSTFWAHLQAIPVLNGECRITLKDITDRKRTEEELIRSEERLHFALETCHIGAWDIDMADHTAFRSLEHDLIFGYPELLTEWTYEMFLEHVLPEDRDKVNETFKHALENRSDWNFECRIHRADGQVRWIWAAGRHRKNTEGASLSMAGIVQDITERKLVEEQIIRLNTDLEKRVTERTAALANANEKLRQEIKERQQVENALRLSNEEWLNTFNASSDPIFLLDTDHHITQANKAMAAMVGLPAEDIVGRLCHEIIHYSDAPAALCPQCLLLEDFQSHTSEIFVENLNRYILVTVSPIFDSTYTMVGSIHYAKDITKIKEAEQIMANAKSALEHMVTERTAELAQTHEQMKKVSFELIWAEEKERERIAAELHDQVGQSLLLAKMKLDALEDKLSDDSLHVYAMEASSLIATSIQDIRSLTFRMRPPILDTAGIETVLKWLCSSISHDYSIQVEFTDNCQYKPPLSTELRYSLYQAVRELLLNVVKHARTETAQLTLATEDQNLVVKVADNGVGFNRPDAIMKHVHNGGYGLYNVLQRIEQIDGRFAVESAPGMGTSVTLSVPLSKS